MMWRTAVATVIALTATTGTVAAEEKLSKQMVQLLAMTPDQFAAAADVKDDELEVTAVVSTSPAFQERHGLLKIVWNDNFLRAFINKQTGAVSYQLYQRILYGGSGWRFYQLANYETPDGPKSVEATKISSDVDCSTARWGGCTYAETVAFDVDEALLKRVAASYQPNMRSAWKFRFKAKSGQDFDDALVAAEAAGMLQAVAAYRSSKGLTVNP